MSQDEVFNDWAVADVCPAHPSGLEACFRAAEQGVFVDGCTGFEESPTYIPRKLDVRLEAGHLKKLRAKKKSQNKDGESLFLSPSERLMLEVARLRRMRSSKKLSTQAFSIVVSLVNHHINQYRKQCGDWIRSTYLEDLVISDLQSLGIYGFREWVPDGEPVSHAIQWDKAVEDAIRRNLPNIGTMDLTTAAALAEEIDRNILQEAEHANSMREKGLITRRLKTENDYARWVRWRSESFSALQLRTLTPSVEYRALQTTDLSGRIGFSKLKNFRSRLNEDFFESQ